VNVPYSLYIGPRGDSLLSSTLTSNHWCKLPLHKGSKNIHTHREKMSHVQSSGVKPPNTESTETIGKQLFRHAWEYVQRIDQATRSCRSTADLFKPELQNLRRKLREKCELILLLSCSYRRKTEELLWKKAFYEVVQRCKAHKQALDVGSPLSQAYHDHLSSGSNYYVELLQKLEVQYGVTVAGLDGSQLEGT